MRCHPPEHAPSSTGDRFLYLYGVTLGGSRPSAALGGGCELMAAGRLAAWVEWVPAEEFAPDAVERKLQSLDAVAPLAQKHDTILELAMREGPIFPSRLCTLFSGEASLRARLAENEDHFLRTLKTLVARREWGLKVYCREDELRRRCLEMPRERQLDAGAGGPGHAYIAAKMRERQVAQQAGAFIDAAAQRIVDSLAPLAFAVRRRSVEARNLQQRQETLILSLAALIDHGREQSFHDKVAELSAEFQTDVLLMELSGPWAPYSFCEVPVPEREMDTAHAD